MSGWMPLLLKTVLISLPVGLIGIGGSRLLRSSPWKRQRNFINLIMAALVFTPFLVWIGPVLWQINLPPPEPRSPMLLTFSQKLIVSGSAETTNNPSIGMFLIVLWIVGFIAGILHLLWGITCIQRYIRSSYPLDSETISHKMALHSTCSGNLPMERIRLSDRIKGPAAAGFLRAWILIPKLLFRHMDANEFRAVVLHEWAHVRNRDGLFTLLGELAVILYWWNPAVRMLQRRRLMLQEMIGDETAVEIAGGLDYAKALLSLAEKSRHNEELKCVLAFFGPLGLKERIERILSKEGKMNLRKMKLGFLFIGGLALALTLAASGTKFVTPSPEDGQKEEANAIASTPITENQAEKTKRVAAADQPKVIKRVVPVYPEEAKKNRITGQVVVEITIDEQGRVTGAKAISGHPLLNDSALNAVKQWLFEPYIENGTAQKVAFSSIITFKLSEDDQKAVSKAEEPMKVDGYNAPKLIRRVEPDYPKAALEARVQGRVILQAVTDEFGRVVEVKHIPDPKDFNDAPEYQLLVDASTTALKQWLYEPYIVDGVPKSVRFNVYLTFKLGEDDKKPD